MAERCCQQAGRLRRQLEPPGIGAAHDYGEARKCIRTERKLLNHHVKGALVPPVVPKPTPDIEGRRLELFCYSHHFGWCYEQEDGLAIDEAANQPWAGDAYDLRPCPRYPNGAALGIACRDFARWDKQMALRAPGSKTTFERLGHNTLMSQPSTDALAALQAVLADNDDGLTFKARCRASGYFQLG